MPTTPSPSMLRELSDDVVLRALMDVARMTRAELALATGLSKPTVADAIRRLEQAGLVTDTGERTTTRGGVGTYYALADAAGHALAIAIAPDGVVVELIDATGAVRSRVTRDIGRPESPSTVKRLLGNATRSAIRATVPARVRLAVVSAADPVDRSTGALVHLPDAPLLIGELAPNDVLGPLVDGQVHVDNDINWAARAEREARRTADGASVDDFVYVYLGEGVGAAVMADGQVLRGHRGIAGEIEHVLTADAHGRAAPFTTVFEQLGLRYHDSTAIDIDGLLHVLGDRRRGPRIAGVLARALCGVLAAATAFCDPELVVLGGPWSGADRLVDEVRRQLTQSPRPVRIESARATEEPSLSGVRHAALRSLRDTLVAQTRVSTRVENRDRRTTH